MCINIALFNVLKLCITLLYIFNLIQIAMYVLLSNFYKRNLKSSSISNTSLVASWHSFHSDVSRGKIKINKNKIFRIFYVLCIDLFYWLTFVHWFILLLILEIKFLEVFWRVNLIYLFYSWIFKFSKSRLTSSNICAVLGIMQKGFT